MCVCIYSRITLFSFQTTMSSLPPPEQIDFFFEFFLPGKIFNLKKSSLCCVHILRGVHCMLWPQIGSKFCNICGFLCGTKYSFHHQMIAVPQNIGLNLYIWYCMWEKEEFQLRHFSRAFINFGWKADSGKTTWMAPFCVFPSFCTAKHSFSRILLFRSFLYFLDRVFGSLASVQTFFPLIGWYVAPALLSLQLYVRAKFAECQCTHRRRKKDLRNGFRRKIPSLTFWYISFWIANLDSAFFRSCIDRGKPSLLLFGGVWKM